MSEKHGKAEFADLVDAWWKTAEVFDSMPGDRKSKDAWHGCVFQRILSQCSWTVSEWNEEVDRHKKEKAQ